MEIDDYHGTRLPKYMIIIHGRTNSWTCSPRPARIQSGGLLSQHRPDQRTEESFRLKEEEDPNVEFYQADTSFITGLRGHRKGLSVSSQEVSLPKRSTRSGGMREMLRRSNSLYGTKDSFRVANPTNLVRRTRASSSASVEFSEKFAKKLKKHKLILPCENEADAKSLLALVSNRDSNTLQEIRQAALVAVVQYVFPDRPKSPARRVLKTPKVLRDLLRLAMDGLIHISSPVEYDGLCMGKMFARGAGGSIFEGTYKGEEVVIKKSSPTDLCYDLRAFLLESTIMTLFQHSNLLPCIAAGERAGDCIMILPKYECSLDEKMIELHELPIPKPIIIAQLIKILLFVCHGVKSLHSSGIVHRDLKPENILIREDRSKARKDSAVDNVSWFVVVADFGTARSFYVDKEAAAPPRMTMNIGTQRFTAPEVFTSEDYSASADIFSFGILAFETLTCRAAFDPKRCASLNKGPVEMMLEGGRPQFEAHERDLIPKHVVDLIKSCWSHNPQERPTISSISIVLNTTYMQMIRQQNAPPCVASLSSFGKDAGAGPGQNEAARSENSTNSWVRNRTWTRGSLEEDSDDAEESDEEDKTVWKSFQLPSSLCSDTDKRRQAMGFWKSQVELVSPRSQTGAASSPQLGTGATHNHMACSSTSLQQDETH